MLGLSAAIKGVEATNFARDKAFKKLPEEKQQALLSSRRKMVVIREPLQSQDSSISPLQSLYFRPVTNGLLTHRRLVTNRLCQSLESVLGYYLVTEIKLSRCEMILLENIHVKS